MKSAFAALKLAALLSVFICEPAFSDVYLSCVNSKKEVQGDSFARLLPFKDQFLATYVATPNKKIMNFDNRLVLTGQQDSGRFVLAAIDGDGPVFDRMMEAQFFCKELEELCQETFADPTKPAQKTPYHYAMGRLSGNSEFFSIGVLYRGADNRTKQFFCPYPDQKSSSDGFSN